MGKVAPGASYSTFKNWVNARGKNPIACPSGDLITYFDNMGKYIVKHYKILSSKKESADITTATLHFVFNDSNLQKEEQLMPGVWRNKDSTEIIQAKMKSIRQSATNSFRSYRLIFIEGILERVAREKQDVEQMIEKKAVELCRTLYTSLKRKCTDCGAKVVFKTYEEVRLISAEVPVTAKTNQLGGEVIKNNAVLNVGEPIMVNPNSYVNVKIVLDHLIAHEINSERKWVILGCDGPPYCMASRIIASNSEEYNCVTLSTGLGHLHMNELKSLFKVADKIILEPLGKEVLGFISDKAYSYFIAAKDIHKSYETLCVLLEGTAMEMCVMYYVKELNGIPATARGFLNWCSNNSNETFSLIYQLIFNFALSIYVQKVGVRLNNWEMIDAGRLKFLPFFYSFNHPIYQEGRVPRLSKPCNVS